MWTVQEDKMVVEAAMRRGGNTGLAYSLSGEGPERLVHAVSVAHASRLKWPEDFDLLVQKSGAPLQIHSCEVDGAFPAEACASADEVLGGGKYAPGYERVHWEGCNHGFAVRGDLVRAGSEFL